MEQTNATGDPAKLKEERIAIRDFLINAQDLPGIQGSYNYQNGIQVTPVQFMQIVDNAAVLRLHNEFVPPVEMWGLVGAAKNCADGRTNS